VLGKDTVDLQTLRVLVVDDDVPVRTAVVSMLRELGVTTITTADNAHAALEMVERNCPFELVITDVVMPGVNGIAMTQLLQQICPRLPIVLMTGYAEKLDEVIQGGILALMKPFTIDMLRRVIEDALIIK